MKLQKLCQKINKNTSELKKQLKQDVAIDYVVREMMERFPLES